MGDPVEEEPAEVLPELEEDFIDEADIVEGDGVDDEADIVDEDDIVGGPVHVMYERLAQDDYEGAQLVAEAILDREPAHQDALQCLALCDGPLRKLYLSRVGSLARVPQLARESELMLRRVADSRIKRMLELVDGLTPLGKIVDASGMTTTEALRIASELYLRQLVEFEDE